MSFFFLYGPILTLISPRESQAREMSAQGWTASMPPQRKVTEEASDRVRGSPARGRGQPREPRTKTARSLARGQASLAVNSNRTPARGWTREPPTEPAGSPAWVTTATSRAPYWARRRCLRLFLIHVEPGAGARMANGQEGRGWKSARGGRNFPVEMQIVTTAAMEIIEKQPKSFGCDSHLIWLRIRF